MNTEPATARPPGHAIVTGGSSGIGLELAKLLAERSFDVTIIARDVRKLANARDEIQAAGKGRARVATYSVDVGETEAFRTTIKEAVTALGPPTWTIASAGIVEPGDILDLPLDSYERQMRTNFSGSLNLAHAVAPEMAANGGGRLVLIASGAAFVGLYGYSAYTASKFAVRGLAESLRLELEPQGISVTLAYPPDTRTPQYFDEMEKRSAVTAKIAGRGGLWDPEDVARRIFDAADRKAFTVTPGLVLRLLNTFHSVISPFFRAYQNRLVRSVLRKSG